MFSANARDEIRSERNVCTDDQDEADRRSNGVHEEGNLGCEESEVAGQESERGEGEVGDQVGGDRVVTGGDQATTRACQF